MTDLKEDHKEFIKNNRVMLKSQWRVRIEKHNVFSEDLNKIELSTNDDKRMQSINSIETYAYGTKEEIKQEKIN